MPRQSIHLDDNSSALPNMQLANEGHVTFRPSTAAGGGNFVDHSQKLCGYEPFYSDNQAMMYRRIIKCDYKFDSPWWDEVSDNAKDFVRKLLRTEPHKRLSAAQALQHPWVRGTAKSSHMEEAQTQLKQFNARRKIRVATDVIAACSFLPKGQLDGNRSLSDNVAALHLDSDDDNL